MCYTACWLCIGFVASVIVINRVQYSNAFGFHSDTLRGAIAAVRKRQSMTSNNLSAAGGTSVVPRSTSQPGNCWDGFTLSATSV